MGNTLGQQKTLQLKPKGFGASERI